ncbi:MAG: AraC family transcriptional regulator [Bacteroidales bacterium]|nr:AraC family transcriptional regulator [Bacteroidales bacterium]
MEQQIYILFTFGYVVVFGILAAIALFLQTSHEKGMESYRKARKTLGIALLSMSLFSILRLIFPQHHHDYEHFWILVTYTLVFSWLTYATILFLIETPRYLRKAFFIDGIIPTAAMIILGIIGHFMPSIQKEIMIAFGIVFGIKCIWIFITCEKEYKQCIKEIDNYYDDKADMTWLQPVIMTSFILSVFTIIAFYVTYIHLIYYLSIPILYAFFVFKIVNFAPKKIDVIRKQNETMDKPVEKKQERAKGLDSKIGPLVAEWVSSKRFCSPGLTIKDVAQDIGTNHNYLSAYINNHLNMTFQVWLNTLRIEESKTILTDGSKKSIEEVGAMVGIPQSYNFSRWFRTITGTTPFRYRQNN